MPVIQTIQETTTEKLKPPTQVAGQVAELAEVTRFYHRDFDTGVRTEYGVPLINVIWGKTSAVVVADIQAEKLKVQADADKRLATLNAAEVAATAAAADVADPVVTP